MERGPKNYDFAGMQINTGPLPAKEITVGEWERAQKQKVGGMRKKCRKGKNCSATCIALNEDCVVDLPRPMQREIRKMAIYILRRNKLKEGSLEDKRVGAALMQMSPVMKTTLENKPETSGRGKEKLSKGRATFETKGVKRAERPQVSWEEIQSLKRRRNLLGESEFNEEAMKLLQKDAFGRGLRLRRNELEMVYDALPKSAQDSLSNSGKATGKWWAGKDEDGNDIFSKSPSKERGLAVLDMWFRQGGTDAYQGRGGKIRPPQEYDVEHVRPMSKGGVDSPSNWILARAGAQRKRQNEELGQWIDSLPKSEREQRQYLSELRTQKSKKNISKSIQQSLNPKDFTDKEIFGWGASKSGKAFGMRTVFTSEFQPIKNVGGTAGRANSGPPQPFAKAIALVAKNQGPEEAKKLTYGLRDIWNKQLIESGSITPKEAYSKMTDLVQSKLTPEQNSLFRPSVEAWAQSREVQPYGFQ